MIFLNLESEQEPNLRVKKKKDETELKLTPCISVILAEISLLATFPFLFSF